MFRPGMRVALVRKSDGVVENVIVWGPGYDPGPDYELVPAEKDTGEWLYVGPGFSYKSVEKVFEDPQKQLIVRQDGTVEKVERRDEDRSLTS